MKCADSRDMSRAVDDSSTFVGEKVTKTEKGNEVCVHPAYIEVHKRMKRDMHWIPQEQNALGKNFMISFVCLSERFSG